MATWHTALDDWFRTHHGIASSAELLRLGVSTRTISRMCAAGRLRTVLPGVHLSAQWTFGPEQVMRAACARNPHAAIGFTTAARLWGLRRVDDRRIHVLVPHGCSPELEGIVVHRCRRIDAVDLVERPDGIRLTSPPRTLFDAADLLGHSATRSILEQVINEHMCSLDAVVDTFSRLAHPHRPGSRTMSVVIGSRPQWRRALQSNLEARVLEEIERQNLPRPVAQCPVRLADGTTIHLDFGWPQWRVGVEVDDPTWHAGFEEHHRDTRRDRKAAAMGWTVPRVSRTDVDRHLGEAVRDLGAVLRARGWIG